MDTKSEDRLLRVAVAALLVTLGGELLGSDLLLTAALTVFVLALVALFAVMSVVLVVGVARESELPSFTPELAEEPR